MGRGWWANIKKRYKVIVERKVILWVFFMIRYETWIIIYHFPYPLLGLGLWFNINNYSTYN